MKVYQGLLGYVLHSITQNGKLRRLEEPMWDLMEYQRSLIPLLEKETIHPAAMSTKGGGTKKNANAHLHNKTILKLDIKKCYHSIKSDLISSHLSSNRSFSIYDLLFEGRLPTGAPTSPILCNIALRTMDEGIQEIADEYGYIYTRYLDDITLSSNHSPDSGFYKKIKEVIESQGLKVNNKKTKWHVLNPSQRVQITGVSLTEDRLTLPRKIRRIARAALNKDAYELRKMSDKTQGYMAYIKSIDSELHDSLFKYFQSKLQNEATQRINTNSK